MTDNELILKALGVCHTLTYNEEPQGSAKHLLRELAHRLELRSARLVNADQVAWMLAAIGRYMPPDQHPRCSRARDMRTYALLYEVMEAAGLLFEDDVAAGNGTPPDPRMLNFVKRSRATDVSAAQAGEKGNPNAAAGCSVSGAGLASRGI